MPICALCGQDRDLKKSHIIPKFVTERIKKNSPIGFMRNAQNPKVRLQDGDKRPMLCGECEERFSRYERLFAKKIFHPFQDNNSKAVEELEYEEWLNYFISSVNWRNLYLDLVGFVSSNQSNEKLQSKDIEILIESESLLKRYLLGNSNSICNIENHIFFFDKVKNADEDIVKSNPNRFFRSSSFGYTLICHEFDGYYVFSNLAGILICTLLKPSKQDKWENTLVDNKKGKIKIPQYVKSPLMGEIMDNCLPKREFALSEEQQKKISDDLRKNPEKLYNSQFYRYIKWDEELNS
ncbi:hypothetical protein [Clostridium felsineum]|uniref:hypothetical protein n=1 Tax=Clostridium felsineum TaxID=36839 RepID=UPI00098C1CFE|nr:hypothetical protein [Clostridium felsineum]URZ04229.1 hypothetical protein CLAUR_043170 [Clostridium felsineum]